MLGIMLISCGMGLLAPLFSTDVGYWKPLIIIYPAFMVISGLWVYIDANSRVGNGCFWGALAFAVPPIGLTLYYGSLLVMALRNAHGPSGQDRAARAEQEQLRKKLVTQGEIERQKYLEHAETYGGTLFNPQAGMGQPQSGSKHFTDQRAEELIAQKQYEEAKRYLLDMQALASEEHDAVRRETYRYYLAHLPEPPAGPNDPLPK